MHRIGLALCALGIMTACASRAPQQAPAPDPVTELSATVNEFLDAWYIQKDETKFWMFVSKDSPLRGHAEAFSGAFTEPLDRVDPATLKLGIDTVDGGFDEYPELIRNPGNRRFAIIKGESDGAPDKLPTRLEALASTPYFVVLYSVGGEGYLWEGMATFWTRKDGAWKLYDFFGFD